MALSFSGCLQEIDSILGSAGSSSSSSSSSSDKADPNYDSDYPANSASHEASIKAMSGDTKMSCIYHYCITNWLDMQLGETPASYNKLCKQSYDAHTKYTKAKTSSAESRKAQEFYNLCPFDNRYSKSGLIIEKYDGKNGMGLKTDDEYYDEWIGKKKSKTMDSIFGR
ncbi:MAG: hypothetical protein LUC34_05355 [Campylobacter sp.]|nr:hypothetical protein [Campylobacter sp.]